MRSIVFTVEGKPVSQGSLTAIPMNRNWRTVPGVRWTLKDAKADLKPWRKKVADVALEAMNGEEPFDGPVRVRCRFIFERPAAHFLARKSGKVLRPDVPTWVTSHQLGDLDKHVRSIFDALTGVCVNDDAQIVDSAEQKVYGSHPCVMVEVTPLQEEQVTPTGDGTVRRHQ